MTTLHALYVVAAVNGAVLAMIAVLNWNDKRKALTCRD